MTVSTREAGAAFAGSLAGRFCGLHVHDQRRSRRRDRGYPGIGLHRHAGCARLNLLAIGPWRSVDKDKAERRRRDQARSCRRHARDAARALDQFINTQLGGNTRGDPAARWTAADGGMRVLALLLYDTVRRGGFDPAADSYADFLVRALSDASTWPRDLEARYLELTATRHS